MIKTTTNIFTILVIAFLLFSCGGTDEPDYPKPRGFFRISLPEKQYQLFDTSALPFSFRIPNYCTAELLQSNEPGTLWFNLLFPSFHGSVNFSYKPVKNNVYNLSEDAREFVNKHISKADAIEETAIANPVRKVFGSAFYIKGSNTASPYQFFITDSSTHFLRAAVYFNHIPNNDSIEPLIIRIREDMDTLISGLKWK